MNRISFTRTGCTLIIRGLSPSSNQLTIISLAKPQKPVQFDLRTPRDDLKKYDIQDAGRYRLVGGAQD